MEDYATFLNSKGADFEAKSPTKTGDDSKKKEKKAANSGTGGGEHLDATETAAAGYVEGGDPAPQDEEDPIADFFGRVPTEMWGLMATGAPFGPMTEEEGQGYRMGVALAINPVASGAGVAAKMVANKVQGKDTTFKEASNAAVLGTFSGGFKVDWIAAGRGIVGGLLSGALEFEE